MIVEDQKILTLPRMIFFIIALSKLVHFFQYPDTQILDGLEIIFNSEEHFLLFMSKRRFVWKKKPEE